MTTHPPLTVDRSSPVPLYFQVAAQLEHAIADGQLVPGDRIANEVALADKLGLSRPTMRQAIQTLVDKGMLVRKRGVGTQVVHPTISRTVELTSLNDDLAHAGREPRTVVLRLERSLADATLARHVKMEKGCEVWLLESVRYVGEQPLAILANTIPATIVDLDAADLTAGGLYAYLRTCGVHMRVAHQRIGAARADSRQARLLGQRRGDPLLTMERTAFDDSGRTVEFGSHVYRPDLYSFEMTLVDR